MKEDILNDGCHITFTDNPHPPSFTYAIHCSSRTNISVEATKMLTAVGLPDC